MMPDELAALYGWRVILLNGKVPVSRNGHHWITTNPQEIRAHAGNKGLMAGQFAVLDFDAPGALREMAASVATLLPAVQSRLREMALLRSVGTGPPASDQVARCGCR